MNRATAPVRMGSLRNTRSTGRITGKSVRTLAGGGILVVLTLLFWLVFYQTLPDNPLTPTAAELAQAQQAAQAAAAQSYQAPTGGTGNTGDRIIKICMILISAAVIAARWPIARQALRNVNLGLVAFMVLIPM